MSEDAPSPTSRYAQISPLKTSSAARSVRVRSVLRMVLADIKAQPALGTMLPSLGRLFPPDHPMAGDIARRETIIAGLEEVCK